MAASLCTGRFVEPAASADGWTDDLVRRSPGTTYVGAMDIQEPRPVAFVTGASRRIGIGSEICRRLASDGWDIATTYWRPYDERMPWGSAADEPEQLGAELRARGAEWAGLEADLADTTVA